MALLIVYHSRTGGSLQMASAAAEAAREEFETLLVPATDIQAEDICMADGLMFVCPENLAAMTGEMKSMFDRCYYPVLQKVEGRPYAVMVCAGSDGENAVRQIERIATGWRLKKVQDALIVCTHAQTEAEIMAPKNIPERDLQKCRDIGAAFGAGLALKIF